MSILKANPRQVRAQPPFLHLDQTQPYYQPKQSDTTITSIARQRSRKANQLNVYSVARSVGDAKGPHRHYRPIGLYPFLSRYVPTGPNPLPQQQYNTIPS